MSGSTLRCATRIQGLPRAIAPLRGGIGRGCGRLAPVGGDEVSCNGRRGCAQRQRVRVPVARPVCVRSYSAPAVQPLCYRRGVRQTSCELGDSKRFGRGGDGAYEVLLAVVCVREEASGRDRRQNPKTGCAADELRARGLGWSARAKTALISSHRKPRYERRRANSWGRRSCGRGPRWPKILIAGERGGTVRGSECRSVRPYVSDSVRS